MNEDNLIKMLEAIHGKADGAFSYEVTYDDNMNADGVNIMKHGQLSCWISVLEILFEYVAMDL